jgi:undecaprenyl diphosphate synthase
MDGNRRYAKKHNLESKEGHKAGAKKLLEVLEWLKKTDIQDIVVYAFSTENWNRTKEEVSDLMDLFGSVLQSKQVIHAGMRVRFVGDRTRFSTPLRVGLETLEKITSANTTKTLWVALSYGGKEDILHAARKLHEKDDYSENSFEQGLLSFGIPEIDMVIRTGGDKRMSNFLPWQTAYAELFFIDTYWPELTKEEMYALLTEYTERKRNFGK